MKRSFRGNKGNQGNQGKDNRRDSSSKGGQGGHGGKQRKDIKNARSLADVLGGKSGGGSAGPRNSNYGGGNQRPERGGSFRDRNDDQSPHRSTSERGSKGPTSNKLKYIMSFEPPVETPRSENRNERRDRNVEQRPQGRQQSHRQESDQQQNQPGRGTQKGTNKQAQPSQRHPSQQPHQKQNQKQQQQNPKQQQDRNQRPQPQQARGNDYSWPKNRVRAEEPAPQSSNDDRRGTGRKPGSSRVTGIVKRHPDGFGFLIVDQPDVPDVYISRQSMTGIMTNDRVELEIYKPRTSRGGKDDRLSGEIKKVLSRANTRVVGKFLPVDQKYGMLLDENRGWGADLKIATKDSMDAKEGEMVAVEITQYPDHNREFTGRVVSLIGDAEDPVNDVIRVVHMSGIPIEFSKQAVADAREYGGEVTEREREGREDLTDLSLITIDGVTARDFDDAIYTEQTEKGFRLIVAIADVSHYVKPGTRLDEEAYERGTSTYFPNYVVPMLPEELSNELCSLKPNVVRLCFCCEMTIDFQGTVEDYRFFEGVMNSKARVTYGEAQELLDAHDNGTASTNKSAIKFKHVAANIQRSADLAKILMQKRFREGSLDLEIPETQVVVDSSGESTDVIRSQRLFAHRLIEELMLVTNICTARIMEDFQIPGIYRVHEEPDPDSIRSLQRYLWNLGGSKSVMGGGLAKKLTQALEAMKDRPEAAILNILTLRTMKQAHYTQDNVGHFGLGFTHYSHFTSPIRRYPDLIAHRLIKSQLYKKYHSMQMSEGEIASATTWLSACEQRSVKAERKVISIKKARFIRRFEGQEFEGIISSVAKFGCFVLLRQYDVDGLIKVEDLGNDRFQFDEENLRLIGAKTGLRYVIGDAVKVRVVAANPDDGKVTFELAEAPNRVDRGDENDDFEVKSFRREEPARGKKKKFNPEKRGKTKNDRGGVRKERVSKRRRKN